MTYRLRAPTAFAEDLSLSPRTNIVTTAYNSSFKGALAILCTYPHMDTLTHA